MVDSAQVFLLRAYESLAGAESEFANGRYNNCANRSYYACFQAAIYALMKAGIDSGEEVHGWSHASVHARFVGDLINRRKLYPSAFRDTLHRTLFLRHTADYRVQDVSQVQAMRAVRRARRFFEVIAQKGDA